MREKDIKREWQPYNWVVKLREFMSDRSCEDKDRNWELRSIHDVLTDRERRSDPSPDNKSENVEADEISPGERGDSNPYGPTNQGSK